MKINLENKIVNHCIKGNPKAQYQLFDMHCKMVFNTAIRICGNTHEANDITQETFIKVFDKIKSYKRESSVGAWIRKIAINEALKHIERKRFSYVELTEFTPSGVTNDFSARDNEEEIQLAITQLPDGARVVFSLYLIEGFQHKEIAKKLGISESTSKSQFIRAKKLMKQLLKEENYVEEIR